MRGPALRDVLLAVSSLTFGLLGLVLGGLLLARDAGSPESAVPTVALTTFVLFVSYRVGKPAWKRLLDRDASP